MARQATDQLYIELDYYYPEEYLVYIALGQVDLAPWIEDEYLEVGYYEYYGGSATLTCDLTEVLNIEAEAAISTSAALTADIGKIQQGASTMSAEFSQSATISHIEGADLFAFSDAQIAALVDRIRDYNISTSTAFDIASDYIRIRLADSAESAEFSISSSGERSRSFASALEAAFSFASTEDRLRDVTSNLNTEVTVALDASRTRDLASTISSDFATSATATRIQELAANISSEATVACVISHIEGADLVAFSNSAVTADVNQIKGLSSQIQAEATQTILESFVRTVAANVNGEFTVSCTAEQIKGINANSNFAANLTANGTYLLGNLASNINVQANLTAQATIFVRNMQITTFSGNEYDTAVFNASTKKFGTHSLQWQLAAENIAPIKNNIVHDGTNFKVFDDAYTWSSSDGLTWTRSASDKGSTTAVVYANGYYFAAGSNGIIRYSTNATTWSTNDIGDWSSAIGVGYLGTRFYVIYQATSNNTKRIYYARATTLAGSWTGAEITNTGLASSQGEAANTGTVYTGSYLVFAVNTSGGPRVYRVSDSAINGYNTPSGSGVPTSIGYDNSNSFLYQRTGANEIYYSTNLGTNWTSLDLGTGNSISGNSVYANSNWLVPTTYGLYAGSNLTSLTSKDPDTTGAIIYAGSKYLTFSNDIEGHVRYSSNLTTWNTNLIEGTSGLDGKIVYTPSTNDLASIGTIDFWAYNGFYFELKESSSNDLRILSNFTNFISLNTRTDSIFFSETNLLPANTWNHVRIQFSAGSCIIFVNGVYKTQGSLAFTFTNARFEIISNNTAYLLDELLITDEILQPPNNYSPLVWNTNSFTTPTRQWMNTANTDLLLHFNNTTADDSRHATADAAALSSVLTFVSAVGKFITASADLVSQFSLVGEGHNNVQEVASSLNSSVSVSADSTRILDLASNVQSNIAISAVVNVVTDTTQNVTTSATVTVDNARTRDFVCTINSSADIACVISHIHGADLIAFSDAALSVQGLVIRDATSTFNAQSTTVIAFDRLRQYASSQQSAFSLDGTPPGETIRNASSSLVVESLDFYTDPINLRGFASAITSQATVSIQVSKITGYASTLTAVSTQTVDVTKIKQLEANIASEGSQLSIAVKVGRAVIDSAITVILSADAAKSVEVVSNLNTDFAVNAIPVNTYTVPAYLTAASSLSIELGIVKEYTASYNATAAVVANATTSTDIVANVSSSFTQFSVFDLTRGATSNQNAEFTTSIDYTRLRLADVYIDAALTQNTQPNATFDNHVAVVTAFTLGCTISHIEGADLVAFSNAALTIDAFVGKTGEANVNASVSVSADLLRIRSTNSNFVAAFSTNQDINYVANNTANIATEFTSVANGNLVAGAGSNLVTQASVNCTISHIEGADLVAFTNAAVNADANRIRDNASTITASAAISLTATKVKELSSSLQTNASIACDATKVIAAGASINANGNLVAQVNATLGFSITITDAMTFTAGVREIDFDSVLQEVYKIPREIWSYKITQETRLYSIAEETRIYKVRSTT